MSGLSVAEALAELDGIDRSMAAFEKTAPAAFEAFGGREAMLAISQATCVGPVPRLNNEQWAPFAAEHAVHQRGMASSRDFRVGPGVVSKGQELGVDVYPSRRAGPMFARA